MGYQQRKVAEAKSAIVEQIPLACQNEQAAAEFLEQQRWRGVPACPHCGDTAVYKMRAMRTGERNGRFLWRCHGCKKQFTVRVGTVLEESRIPLRFWCLGFWLVSSSKKGISALQIKRLTGLSYKSALFMAHRIRYAMAVKPEGPLQGTVEVDETYVGGKVRYKGRTENWEHFKPKSIVVAMVQRGGDVRARTLVQVTAKTLKAAIRESVAPSALIMTDEHKGYLGLEREYSGGHQTICHSRREYARGDVTTNTVEGFFALLKRGIYGTFHNVSKKHLHRYVSEFEFRFNTRMMNDGERLAAAIRAADGKRLMYHAPRAS